MKEETKKKKNFGPPTTRKSVREGKTPKIQKKKVAEEEACMCAGRGFFFCLENGFIKPPKNRKKKKGEKKKMFTSDGLANIKTEVDGAYHTFTHIMHNTTALQRRGGNRATVT